MNLADVVLVYADAEIPKLRPYLTPRQYVTATNNSLEPSAMLAAQAAWAPRLKEFEGEQGLTDKHLLLFCGRLRPGSQVDVLIRALAYAQVTDNVVLAIIGSGQEEADLRALAEELGVNGSIKWLGAHYEESFLAPWFGLSKCFVYPGSIGLSLLHAFTYGVPVVTHSDSHLHNPEIHALVNRHNGLTFKRGDPRSLWQTITEMIGDDSLRNNLAMKAYVTAHEEWSFARTVHRLVNAVVTASRRGSTHR